MLSVALLATIQIAITTASPSPSAATGAAGITFIGPLTPGGIERTVIIRGSSGLDKRNLVVRVNSEAAGRVRGDGSQAGQITIQSEGGRPREITARASNRSEPAGIIELNTRPN